MSSKRILTGIALFLIVVLLLGEVVGPPIAGSLLAAVGIDALNLKLRWYGGRGAIDCGRVRVGGNPELATTCATAAQSQNRAFFVRYDMVGFDSSVAYGLARDASGTSWMINFDGNPAGSGGTSLLRERAIAHSCPTASTLFVSEKGRLNCVAGQPFPVNNVMSPTMEKY